MVGDVSEILLRDLVRHHATASIPRRLKPQPLVIEAICRRASTRNIPAFASSN